MEQINLVQYLWDTMPKTEDGSHIRLTANEVEQLWWMGFVDTGRISIDEWKSILRDLLQEDGAYLFGESDFLALDKYRYMGEIKVPFNPMKINEGKYTDEGLDQLIELSIVPSCGLPGERIDLFFKNLREDFRDKSDGLIVVKEPMKRRIAELVENNPSPLRNLEILIDNMLHQRGFLPDEEEVKKAEDAGLSAREIARQVSSFSSQPASKSEVLAKDLKKLQKAKEKESNEPDVLKGKEKVELRKIRRSKKGMRG